MDFIREKTQRPITLSLHGWQWFLLGIVLTLALTGGLAACYQGRKISRITGAAVHVDLPADLASYEKIVSISFHKDANGETFKDVTYIGADGKLHSQEFNDWGIFQGEIIWDLAGE
ncbi:MAG: hypothetical protein M3Q45_05135 [Chloroflexota bacterium]|nr:hypothetical protein [Chloroflexota bacterium]